MDNVFTILMCSIIGYVTNYIAIKMLFRPYNEIKILGIRLPFTPGIIPKEKERIAFSISEAISSHILNKEYLKQLITKDKTKITIKRTLKSHISGVFKSDKTIKSLISTDINSSSLENNITDYILRIIKKNLQMEKNIEAIRDFIYVEVSKMIIANRELIRDRLSRKLKEVTTKDSTIDGISKGIKSIINKISKEDSVGDIIGEISYYECEKLILENEDKIISKINDILNKEETKEVIRNAASKIIKNQLGSLVSMFLSQDTIGDRANESIKDYINDTDNRVDLLKGITGLIYNLQQVKVKPIVDLVINNVDLNSLVDKFMQTGTLNNYIDNVINAGSKSIESNLSLTLKDIIYQKIRHIAYSENIQNKIRVFIYTQISLVVNKPFNKFGVAEEKIEIYLSTFTDNLLDFLTRNIDHILNYIDIKEIVKNKIVEFDVKYAEQIILSIVNKELKAITMFGAILGAIIGMVTILIR